MMKTCQNCSLAIFLGEVRGVTFCTRKMTHVPCTLKGCDCWLEKVKVKIEAEPLLNEQRDRDLADWANGVKKAVSPGDQHRADSLGYCARWLGLDGQEFTHVYLGDKQPSEQEDQDQICADLANRNQELEEKCGNLEVECNKLFLDNSWLQNKNKTLTARIEDLKENHLAKDQQEIIIKELEEKCGELEDKYRILNAGYWNPILIAPEGVSIEELDSLEWDPMILAHRELPSEQEDQDQICADLANRNQELEEKCGNLEVECNKLFLDNSWLQNENKTSTARIEHLKENYLAKAKQEIIIKELEVKCGELLVDKWDLQNKNKTLIARIKNLGSTNKLLVNELTLQNRNTQLSFQNDLLDRDRKLQEANETIEKLQKANEELKEAHSLLLAARRLSFDLKGKYRILEDYELLAPGDEYYNFFEEEWQPSQLALLSDPLLTESVRIQGRKAIIRRRKI